MSADERRETKRKAPASTPALNFNYLGQFDQFDAHTGMPFQMASEKIQNEQYPQENKGALLHVVASVSGRQMHIRWLFSRNVFRQKMIKQLTNNYIKELKKIIENKM